MCLIEHGMVRRTVFDPDCSLIIQLSWLGKQTEKLVKGANDAVCLAYFCAEVRAVFKSNCALNLRKDRLPTPSQCYLFVLSASIAGTGMWVRYPSG